MEKRMFSLFVFKVMKVTSQLEINFKNMFQNLFEQKLIKEVIAVKSC